MRASAPTTQLVAFDAAGPLHLFIKSATIYIRPLMHNICIDVYYMTVLSIARWTLLLLSLRNKNRLPFTNVLTQSLCAMDILCRTVFGFATLDAPELVRQTASKHNTHYTMGKAHIIWCLRYQKYNRNDKYDVTRDERRSLCVSSAVGI